MFYHVNRDCIKEVHDVWSEVRGDLLVSSVPFALFITNFVSGISGNARTSNKNNRDLYVCRRNLREIARESRHHEC